MRVSHSEGLASHIVPESCRCLRKRALEALTGERMGRVLSRERKINPGCRRCSCYGRQHRMYRYREICLDPAWSETLCTYGSSSHGTREVPSLALACCRVRVMNPKGVRLR